MRRFDDLRRVVLSDCTGTSNNCSGPSRRANHTRHCVALHSLALVVLPVVSHVQVYSKDPRLVSTAVIFWVVAGTAGTYQVFLASYLIHSYSFPNGASTVYYTIRYAAGPVSNEARRWSHTREQCWLTPQHQQSLKCFQGL